MSTHGGGPLRSRDIYNARQLRATLDRVEDGLRSRRTEYSYVFDRYGNQVGARAGGPDRVDFEEWQFPNFNGATLTHNHPGGGSFSIPDVLFAQHVGLAEIRAVGATYRYSLRPPKSGWASIHSVWHESLESALRDSQQFHLSRVRRELAAGELTQEEAQEKYSHQMILTVADEFGLTYRRSRWK